MYLTDKNTKLVESQKEEICKIYQEYQKMSLDKAVQMGRLLTVIKDQVGYGNFGTWIENNLPFSQQSAERYMGVYLLSIREEGLDPKLGLDEAYKLLPHKPRTPVKAQPKPEPKLESAPPKNPQTVDSGIYSVEKAKKVQIPQSVDFDKDEEESEVAEAEVDEQDGLLEDLKDIFVKLDRDHKNRFLDWIEELLEQVEKEAA